MKKEILNNLITTISPLRFQPSNCSFEDANFIIVGVLFDNSSSFRSGSKHAPNAIREASFNFENYLFEHDLDLSEIPICDIGNLDEFGDSKEMLECIKEVVKIILEQNKFPVILGGEHFMTSTVVSCFYDVSVIILDAHLDFRDSYMGNKYSHACGTRRVFDNIGKENISIIGVRSMSTEEKIDSEKYDLKYFSSFEVKEIGIEKVMNKVLESIKNKKIYLSLDMDVIDPAYAPAVGNPEPFGLSPFDVKKCINLIGKRLVGFEITEVSPIYDNGNTSSLTARFIREVIIVTKTA